MISLRTHFVACALLAALLLIAPAAIAQERPELEIPRLERPPTLEEFLDMRGPDELTSTMAHVSEFTQRKPTDGAPASQKTDVYLGYDDEHLYVVFIAFDDEPENVRAHMARRENVFGDDIVEIQVDTFLDQQRAFTFITNPFGIQLDALWTEGSEFDTSWNTVWHSRGELTSQGYVVWMAIPFRSLRFPPGDEQRWGVVLVRDVQRTNEDTFWPPISNRIEGRLNQAATLTGLRDISPGSNRQIIPYATARSFEAIDTVGEPKEVDSSFDPDVGIDAKFVFDDRFALDLTANPDFSQVESDQPQVTVNQRFEVFFPERRPFFLENANFFTTPFNLLFTRRIADPRVGARLTGRVGKYAVAGLLIDDESPGKRVPVGDPLRNEIAKFGVMRVSRDMGNQSTLGMTYTERRLDARSNRVTSLDARIKLNANWISQLQAVVSSTAADGGRSIEDQAYNVQFDRSGRSYNAHIHYREVGADFVTDAGFIQRTDVRNLHTRQGYRFWFEDKPLISMEPSLLVFRVDDSNGDELDRGYTGGWELEFRRQTTVNLSVQRDTNRLRPIDLDNIVDPINPNNPPIFTQPLQFDVQSESLRIRTRPTSAFETTLRLAHGEEINFRPSTGMLPSALDTFRTELETTLRPTTPTRLTLSYLATNLDDKASGDSVLEDRITRVRLDWQLNRHWSLRFIGQHESTDVNATYTRLNQRRRLNGDLLATYLVNPWTALYIGYNTNYLNRELILNPMGNQLSLTGSDLNRDSQQLFVKFSYLIQR